MKSRSRSGIVCGAPQDGTCARRAPLRVLRRGPGAAVERQKQERVFVTAAHDVAIARHRELRTPMGSRFRQENRTTGAAKPARGKVP